MIQKTLITNSSTKLIGFATDIAGSDELARSGDAILFFSDQNDDKDHLHKQIAIIRQCLPDVKVVGITMPGNGVMHEYDNMGPMAGFSMMMLDTAKANLKDEEDRYLEGKKDRVTYQKFNNRCYQKAEEV